MEGRDYAYGCARVSDDTEKIRLELTEPKTCLSELLDQ